MGVWRSIGASDINVALWGLSLPFEFMNATRFRLPAPRTLVLAALLGAGQPPLFAATSTWTGGAGTDPNWSNPANWSGGVPASSQDTAVIFDGTANLTPQQYISTDFLLNALSFNPTAGAFTLGGNPLDFRTNTAGTLPTLTQNAASNETINENLVLANNLSVGVTGTGTLTLRGAVTSTGGALIKTGTGNLILAGASDLTGFVSSTTYSSLEAAAGTLTIGTGGSVVGNNYVTVDGGAVLVLNGTGSLRATGLTMYVEGISASNPASLTVSDNATLSAPALGITYANATQNGGSVNVTGTITVGDEGSATYAFNAGALTAGRLLVSDGNPGTFTQSGGTVTVTSLLLGSSTVATGIYALNGGTLTANGAANLVSSKGRAGSGVLLFNGGTLRAGASTANFLLSQAGTGTTPGSATFTVQAGGARIDTNGFNDGATAALVHDATAGAPATDGGLTKLGAGTLTLGGANTYTGGTLLNAGTVQFAKVNAMPATGTVAVASGATLAVNVGGPGEFTNATAGAGSLGGLTTGTGGQGAPVAYASGTTLGIDTTNAGGNFTYAGLLGNTSNAAAPFPNLTKLGSGTLTLAGSNTAFVGTTTLAAGTLNLGTSNALLNYVGSIVFAGGTLQFSAANQSDYSSRFTGAANQAYAIDTNGQNVTFATALTSPGGILTKLGTGTLTLTGANTFTGPLGIYAGAVAAGSEASLGGGSVVTLNGGGTLQFTGNPTLARTYALGTGTLAATSGQTLTLGNGANVNGGFLAGPGTVALGSGSTLTGVGTQVASTLTQTDGGAATLNNATVRGVLNQTAGTLALNNTTGATSSRVSVSGTVNATGAELDGTTTINSGGTLNATGTSLYLGGGSRTTVSSGGTLAAGSGQTIELNGGLLTNNGAQTGALNVNYGSAARGTGTFGTVTVGSGGKFGSNAVAAGSGTNAAASVHLAGSEALLASGAATRTGPTLSTVPARASVGNLALGGGSLLAINVQNAGGAAGTGYDSVAVQGALTLSGYNVAGNQITVGLASLDGNGAAGTAANFDPSQPYVLTLVTAAGGIQGFDASAFQVDTSGFQNNLNGGHFFVAQSGNNLNLDFAPVPEPATWLGGALLLGGAALTLGRRGRTSRV